MANENMIKFLRGNVADLPQTATAGALYFTKDEGVYLGLENGTYHRYGDFITVADVNSLPSTGAHETCMYYCTSENILARYDSVKGWVQINKQPTADEMKELLGLGDLAYLDEVSEDNLADALAEKINNKVDKVTGKSLVDDAEITKLAGVSEGANKVEASENGKIKIDGVDTVVYTHPDKHSISEVDGLQDALDGKSDDGHKHVKADITDFDHTHVSADITDLDDTIKGYDYVTKSYVGDIPNGEDGNPMAASVIAYINKKTDGIATSGNLEALGNRVTTAEGEIDALQEASAKHVEKVEGKSLILDSEIERLAGMSDGANKVEASTNGKIKIDGVDTVVYTHPEKHTIAEVDGLQDALDGKSDDDHKHVSADITDLDNTIKGYDYATKGEAKGYADAKDEAIANALKAGTDAASALNTYKGEMVTTLAGKQDVIPENTYDAYGTAGQALVDAKAYVNEEDIFETDMNTINALGGIAAGTNLNGLTTHEVLKKLLYPYVDATVGNATATPNGGTYEKGATKTITQVSISVTKKSEPITSVALYNGSTLIEEKTGDAVKNGGTITFSGLSVEVPTNGNQLTVKVTYPDANGNAKTVEKKTTALTFVYPYYMGTCAAGTTIDETLVESLTKKIEGKGNKSHSFDLADSHIVFAYYKSHGALKSIIDPNGYETISGYNRSEVSVTGLDGTAQTYYVYVSKDSATSTGFTVNFKY